MPFTLDADAETGVIRVIHTGEVTTREIAAADDAALSHPVYRKDQGRLLHILSSGADISSIDFNALARDIAPLVQATAERRGQCRIAWIIEDEWNKPIFEIWRHMGVWEGFIEFSSFTAEPQARAWLTR